MRRPLLLIGLLACNTPAPTVQPVSCVLVATPEVTEVRAGDDLRLVGGPFTAVWDTVVRIGGLPAEVQAVLRTDCETCDTCRSSASCSACGACDDCTESCASCVETIDVLVPPAAPGPQPVVVFGRYGGSSPSTLFVLPDDDSDPPLDSETDP